MSDFHTGGADRITGLSAPPVPQRPPRRQATRVFGHPQRCSVALSSAPHVRAARDGLQHPHRHRLFLSRLRAAWRRHWTARARLGPLPLRRPRGAHLPRGESRGRQQARRVPPRQRDRDEDRARAHPPEDARRRLARERAPVHARAVGPNVQLRAQRQGPERASTAAPRPLLADRHHRQRARLLLAPRADRAALSRLSARAAGTVEARRQARQRAR